MATSGVVGDQETVKESPLAWREYPGQTRAVTGFTGVVIKRPYAVGSKSEHDAVLLRTDDEKEYVLRRKGGNAFSDPELDQLIGKHVSFDGTLRDRTLIISRYSETRKAGR